MAASGTPYANYGLAKLCQTCQLPAVFSEPGDPTRHCYRETVYKGEKFHFCSDGCQDIFEHEPAKYVQAWLPMNQLFPPPNFDDPVGRAWCRARGCQYV